MRYLLFLFGWVSLLSCSGIQPLTTIQPGPGPDDYVIVIENPVSLADYLRHVPGLGLSGQPVRSPGKRPPLFVLDDVAVGSSYAYVNGLVNVFDIDRVEVSRDAADIAMYGFRGHNAIIKIYTLKGTESWYAKHYPDAQEAVDK